MAVVANAGANTIFAAAALPGAAITLTAAASDLGGGASIASAVWSIISQPAGGAAVLSAPTSLSTTFGPFAVVGTYVYSLVITTNIGGVSQTDYQLMPDSAVAIVEAYTANALLPLPAFREKGVFAKVDAWLRKIDAQAAGIATTGINKAISLTTVNGGITLTAGDATNGDIALTAEGNARVTAAGAAKSLILETVGAGSTVFLSTINGNIAIDANGATRDVTVDSGRNIDLTSVGSITLNAVNAASLTRVLKGAYINLGTSGTSGQNLDTLFIPHALCVPGARFSLEARFTTVANVNSKTAALRLDSTDIVAFTDTTSGFEGHLFADIEVQTSSQGFVRYYTRFADTIANQNSNIINLSSGSGFDFHARGTSPIAAGEITLKSWSVTYYPAVA